MCEAPLIIAHRGYWEGAARPENSRRAVEAACREGWGLEIDVRATRDGVLVLSHDETTERVYGEPRIIGSSDHVSVRMLCRFEEALRLAAEGGSTVFVHVKEPERLSAVVEAVERAGMTAGTILFGDNEQSRPLADACATRHPQARTALHVTSAEALAEARGCGTRCFWLDEVPGDWLGYAQIGHVRDVRGIVYAVSPEVWAPATPRERVLEKWRAWMQWGVDGICTDWPAALRALAISR